MQQAEVMAAAGLLDPAVDEFVRSWAEHLEASHIEVVGPQDRTRLLEEAREAGELLPVKGDRWYSRSHPKDTARTEERTFVATDQSADQGIYNNWRDSSALRPKLRELMQGSLRGKTLYVMPYVMAPTDSVLAKHAVGIQLTDSRVVVLQMMLMGRIGVEAYNRAAVPGYFVRGVHITGELQTLKQGTDRDVRHFVTFPREREILHYGSAYGGNALLGKIAHALRLASFDGWRTGDFMAEQFMLLGITDLQTGRRFTVCGGFPSASGKTNLAMTLPPDALGDQYRIDFYGDDIVWLRVGSDGRLYGMNPENGVFGVARDTNEKTNPNAISSIAEGSGAMFTNVAYHPEDQLVWWEGRTKATPDPAGWVSWHGEDASALPPENRMALAHPNARFTTALDQVPNLADDYEAPQGVPIDAIIFGGRTRDREPLVRVMDDYVEGIYDGFTLGAEATFAADGLDGQLRYDPMSMRPFMSLPESQYLQHWLTMMDQLASPPLFAHVNWFQRNDDGGFLWPGFRENVRALVWLMQYAAEEVTGSETPVGVIPTVSELNRSGLQISESDLDQLLHLDLDRWVQEMRFREEHLHQFSELPERIWQAHRRVSGELQRAGTHAGVTAEPNC
ncbi:MAG: phosphoenolpyruvate carboxykinase (GTP) [Micrococcaceae bacterium]